MTDPDQTPPTDERVLAEARTNPLPYWLLSGLVIALLVGMSLAGRGLLSPPYAVGVAALVAVGTFLSARSMRYRVTTRRVVEMQYGRAREVAVEDIASVERRDGRFGTTLLVTPRTGGRPLRLEYLRRPDEMLAALDEARRPVPVVDETQAPAPEA